MFWNGINTTSGLEGNDTLISISVQIHEHVQW